MLGFGKIIPEEIPEIIDSKDRKRAGKTLEVGEGKIEPIDVKNILEAEDRLKAGKTLPPHGLYLVKVNY